MICRGNFTFAEIADRTDPCTDIGAINPPNLNIELGNTGNVSQTLGRFEYQRYSANECACFAFYGTFEIDSKVGEPNSLMTGRYCDRGGKELADTSIAKILGAITYRDATDARRKSEDPQKFENTR